MSDYLHGTDILVGYNAPETRWYSIATPGRILAEMDIVLAEVKALDFDIQGHKTEDPSYPAFKRAWAGFCNAYKKFYSDSTGWFSRWSGSTGDKAVDYGKQLNDWSAKFKKFGGITGTPDPKPESKFPWTPIMYGVIVVGGIGATGYALSKAGALGKLFARKV